MYKSITTDDMRAAFEEFFLLQDPERYGPILQAIDWDAWLLTPGMGPVQNEFGQELAQAAVSLAKSCVEQND